MDEPSNIPDLDKIQSQQEKSPVKFLGLDELMDAMRPKELTEEERAEANGRKLDAGMEASMFMLEHLRRVAPLFASQMSAVYSAMMKEGFTADFSAKAALIILQATIGGGR